MLPHEGPHDNGSCAVTQTRTGRDGQEREIILIGPKMTDSKVVDTDNTILTQRVLEEPGWAERLTDADRRALSPLYWSNVRLYGTFRLNMDSRLDFGLGSAASDSGEDSEGVT